VILVGTLVLGEADIAVDPHHRRPDLRHGLGIGGEPAKERPDRFDESHGGLEQVLLIVVVVGVEPLLGVVATEVPEERRGRAEPLEAHAATLRRPTDTDRPVYFGGQLHMGVYWFRLGRITVWVKRAVIPDVTLNAGPTQAPTTSSRSLPSL
jgi:hypothetical protein